MKLLYVVNTRHDEEAYKAYARVHMDGRVTTASRIFSLVSALVILTGGVLAVIRQGFRLLYVATIIVGLLVLFGRPLGLWRMRNRLIQNARNMQNTFDYRFGENTFEVSFPGENQTVPYDRIRKIVETAGYYFVYVDERMAHILPKKDFSQGSAAAFGAFLSEKSGVTVVQGK